MTRGLTPPAPPLMPGRSHFLLPITRTVPKVYFRKTGYHPIEAAEAGFRHIVGSPDPASATGDEPGPRHPGSLHSQAGTWARASRAAYQNASAASRHSTPETAHAVE